MFAETIDRSSELQAFSKESVVRTLQVRWCRSPNARQRAHRSLRFPRSSGFLRTAVLERVAEFLLPPSCIFDRVCVDCLIGTAVGLTIRLIVCFEIDSASCNTPG